jgi:Lysine methyltransferase
MEDPYRALNKYPVPRDSDGNLIEIEIHIPPIRAENLNLTTWGSSYILASQLHQLKVDTSSSTQDRIKILELGAGTGLVGLSAAAIWKTDVVLTDLEPIVSGLAKNIEANQEILAVSGASATCGALDWNQPGTLTLHSRGHHGLSQTFSSCTDKATVIFAADTIYSEEHPLMLTTVIFAWLKPGSQSRAIIACPLRVAYLDAIRELWERLEQGGLHAIDEGRAETGEEWDDERYHEWSVWAWKKDI